MCPICSRSDTVAGFRVYVCIGQAWARLQKDLNAGVGVHDGIKKNNRESLIDFEEGRLLIEQCFKRKKKLKKEESGICI